MKKIKNHFHEVHYYECDRMGVTHHSNYVRIMEEARVDWMDQMGYGFDRMEAEGVVSPVVSLDCRYKHPTTFKDIIETQINVANLSPLKITFSYQMTCNGQTVCSATSTHCFMDRENRPVQLQKRFPELHAAIVELMASERPKDTNS